MTALVIAGVVLGILVVASGNIVAHLVVTWNRARKFNARAAEFERQAHEEANRLMAYIDEKHREALRRGVN